MEKLEAEKAIKEWLEEQMKKGFIKRWERNNPNNDREFIIEFNQHIKN